MVRGCDIRLVRQAVLSLICFLAAVSCSGKGTPVADCEISRGACMKRIGDIEVILDINPKPVRPMKELDFTLELRGADKGVLPKRVLLDLSMPGMEMGENDVILEGNGKGLYLGRGIIVRCPSGKRLWRATLWLPGIGEVSYLFNVER